jgi:molybdopterin-binding protein
MEINALVKSSSVLLLNDPNIKTSARNHLWGEITRIHDGPVNSEITLTMKSGKSVCAVVTHGSVENLGLVVGEPGLRRVQGLVRHSLQIRLKGNQHEKALFIRSSQLRQPFAAGRRSSGRRRRQFHRPMQQIAAEFAKDTGHKAAALLRRHRQVLRPDHQWRAVRGPALPADDTTPAKLEKEGHAVPGSRFTYAVGKLVLWSAKPDFVDAKGEY